MTDIKISSEATKVLSNYVRDWSGLPRGHMVFGVPDTSPYASFNPTKQRFTVNPEPLILNPHRVLRTVTPFRLRQEAVLTGVLLHEVGHARYSTWLPTDEAGRASFVHPDGKPVTSEEVNLALVAEEARIEGLMARRMGPLGLAWTLRASAAHLLPPSQISLDPDQSVLDAIRSWLLWAGRAYTHTREDEGGNLPGWFDAMSDFVFGFVVLTHLESIPAKPAGWADDARTDVQTLLAAMVTWDPEASLRMAPLTVDRASGLDTKTPTFPVEAARRILDLLFPDRDQKPDIGAACLTQPGEGDGEGEGEGQGEGEGDSDGEGSDEGENKIAETIQLFENLAKESAESEAKEEQAKTPPMGAGGTGASEGSGPGATGDWRAPSPSEREYQKGAERFLRRLVDPSETSVETLTDTPSATVDGAALSAWKAGGRVQAPRFFRQTRRESEPSPPVKAAILVDVSGSMNDLQRPSAVLSWALASACQDLKNFAGRGQQVESTLIHWGSKARVVQRNGGTIPGIREVPCNEMTTAMPEALQLAEQEIPGFFDVTEKAENRLLVLFTDWELSGSGLHRTRRAIARALEAGVNILTVVPTGYSNRKSDLNDILRAAPVQRGEVSLLRYSTYEPQTVWDSATELLNPTAGRAPAPFPGF